MTTVDEQITKHNNLLNVEHDIYNYITLSFAPKKPYNTFVKMKSKLFITYYIIIRNGNEFLLEYNYLPLSCYIIIDIFFMAYE